MWCIDSLSIIMYNQAILNFRNNNRHWLHNFKQFQTSVCNHHEKIDEIKNYGIMF